METISVITPTVRPSLMAINASALKKQTFKNWEWLVGAPPRLEKELKKEIDIDFIFVPEPPPKLGDYYGLNRCWNALFRQAKGELIVNIVDGIWIPPDCLEKLWFHYQNNPKSCVSCIGHQYRKLVNNKPEEKIWQEPRARTDQGTFYEVGHWEIELCVASIPKKAIYEVGGIDEEYDKVAALSEKEMLLRITRLGYKCFLDQTNEYRALKHDRLSPEWDEKFKEGSKLYNQHVQEIFSGKRLILDFLKKE